MRSAGRSSAGRLARLPSAVCRLPSAVCRLPSAALPSFCLLPSPFAFYTESALVHYLLHRQRHHRSRRPRTGSQAPRHVHRRRRRHRAAPSGVGGPRQLDRRSDERARVEHPRDAAQGRFVADDRRRRPRHPGRSPSADEEERARGHLHGAPRRRQVRVRQLQDGRRPARCRRQRGQRALARARGHRAARRFAVGDDASSRGSPLAR